MSTPAIDPTYYADFSGLDRLKGAAQSQDAAAIRAAARQFESLFTNMLLKSMRAASPGDGLGDSEQTRFYQDMYDQQLSVALSQGHGLGLADMLVQQLTRSGLVKAGAAAPAAGGTTNASRGNQAAPAAVSSPPQSAVPAAERTRFIQSVAPYAQQAASRLGVSADTLIAQAALETGWGRHLPGGTAEGGSFNLFGLKTGGSWSGAVASARTVEYRNGSAGTTVEDFRSYGSLQQGVEDYVSVLQGHARFRQALGTGNDVTAFASGLQRGGYATDPDYVRKLEAVAGQVRALRSEATPLKAVDGPPTTSGGESV